MKKGEISWPPELFERAAKMWRAGKSGSMIGRVIGKSRSSVIGMMTRNGVQTPTAPKMRGYVTIRKPETPRIAVTSPAQIGRPVQDRPPRHFLVGKGQRSTVRTAPSLPAVTGLPSVPEPPGVLFDALEDSMCHWPVGDGHKHFCGVATARGRTYCPYHEQAMTASGMRAIKEAAELSASAQ